MSTLTLFNHATFIGSSGLLAFIVQMTGAHLSVWPDLCKEITLAGTDTLILEDGL